jgi:hypothetical protein
VNKNQLWAFLNWENTNLDRGRSWGLTRDLNGYRWPLFSVFTPPNPLQLSLPYCAQEQPPQDVPSSGSSGWPMGERMYSWGPPLWSPRWQACVHINSKQHMAPLSLCRLPECATQICLFVMWIILSWRQLKASRHRETHQGPSSNTKKSFNKHKVIVCEK